MYDSVVQNDVHLTSIFKSNHSVNFEFQKTRKSEEFSKFEFQRKSEVTSDASCTLFLDQNTFRIQQDLLLFLLLDMLRKVEIH